MTVKKRLTRILWEFFTLQNGSKVLIKFSLFHKIIYKKSNKDYINVDQGNQNTLYQTRKGIDIKLNDS